MMTTTASSGPVRYTYRHGDLRRALIEAAVALARAGGPEAVALREVTRQAGVVPNAAYRHFANRDDLMLAVRDAALAALANAIERDLAAIESGLKRKAFARASLRAVGLGYLGFAAAEPGLFRTAFMVTPELIASENPGKSAGGRNPFELLGVALDRMLEADLLPKDRRRGAEFLAWSAVHGLAMLLNEGPLQRMSPAQREEIGSRLCEMVERGL